MNSEPIDFARLHELERQAGTRSIVVELAAIFLQDISERLDALFEAQENGDSHGFEQGAHAIKGASVCFGAMRMARIAEHLESSAALLPELTEQLDELQAEFVAVRRVLEAQVLRNRRASELPQPAEPQPA